jgi:AcrR family transcriptional regulator
VTDTKAATSERESAPLGRRERRKIETRRALVDAAYRLFADSGYHETTMEEVADAAGVSRRTAFRYFPTKHMLVFAEHDRRLKRFKELLASSEEKRPYDALRDAALKLAVQYQDQRDYLIAQDRLVQSTPELAGLELRLDKDFQDAIIHRLEDGKRSKKTERRARVLGAAVMGVIRASLREWLDGGGKESLVGLGEEAFRVLERGPDN